MSYYQTQIHLTSRCFGCVEPGILLRLAWRSSPKIERPPEVRQVFTGGLEDASLKE
jgi:hypothetical protein